MESQGAEIIILFLTFSSLDVVFPKFMYNQKFFLLNNALNNATSLAKENKNKQSISEIPIQIITTSCDAINGKYNIFSLTVSFPIT